MHLLIFLLKRTHETFVNITCTYIDYAVNAKCDKYNLEMNDSFIFKIMVCFPISTKLQIVS